MGLTKIYRLEKTTSTNDVAKKLAENREEDFVVHAYVQTSGKGRKGRGWLSPRGGLYFTICTQYDPHLSIRAGVAVARALDDVGISPALKWPNDVLVEDKKICGILIEVMREKALVGIGINLESRPLETSISLSSVTDENIKKIDLIKSILKYFYDDSIESLTIYRKYSSTIGKKVKIETTSGFIYGTVKDVDDKGRLVLESGKKVISGDVIHLKPK